MYQHLSMTCRSQGFAYWRSFDELGAGTDDVEDFYLSSM
jgi:hypothetical protein